MFSEIFILNVFIYGFITKHWFLLYNAIYNVKLLHKALLQKYLI